MADNGKMSDERIASVQAMGENRSLVRRVRRVSAAASVAVTLVGFLVLGGWSFRIATLKQVLPGLVAMNPMTALAFIVAGMCLWLSCRESLRNHPPALRVLADISAVLVAVVGC